MLELTRKNKQPTRDWKPAMVVSILKYKPPDFRILVIRLCLKIGLTRTTKYSKHGSNSNMGEEECFVPTSALENVRRLEKQWIHLRKIFHSLPERYSNCVKNVVAYFDFPNPSIALPLIATLLRLLTLKSILVLFSSSTFSIDILLDSSTWSLPEAGIACFGDWSNARGGSLATSNK